MSSKLSLLLFGLVVMAAIASAMENEEEDLQEMSEELAVEREVREAEPAEDRKKRKRCGKKCRRIKRKRQQQGKERNGKGRARKGGKSKNRPDGRKTLSRASTSLDDSCFETSIQYMKIWKDVVGNFEKQFKRIVKQNSTGSSKSGKKGAFASIGLKLVDVGGGNKSNLSCAGSYSSSGAKQIANLTKTLFNCEMNINASCNPSNLPQPNMTFLNECDNLTKTFKTAAESCLMKSFGANKTTSALACACWTADSLNTTVNAIKSCKASTEAKAMAAALKNCTSAFSTCRKFEDDAGSLISTCSSSSTKLLAKAGLLSANSAAMGSAKTKMSSLASSSSGRKTRATATSCTEVISKSKTLVTMASDSPSSTKVATLSKEISGAGSLTCTDTEKTSLNEQVTAVTSAIATVDTALAAVQTQLSDMTGTTASTSALSSAAAAASSTTAASSGRRARLVREIMKKRNL